VFQVSAISVCLDQEEFTLAAVWLDFLGTAPFNWLVGIIRNSVTVSDKSILARAAGNIYSFACYEIIFVSVAVTTNTMNFVAMDAPVEFYSDRSSVKCNRETAAGSGDYDL